MEDIVFAASRRNVVGKQVNALRRAGQLPAVIYGRQIGAIPLLLDLKEASRKLHGLSASTLVVIQLDGEDFYALVREKQRNPVGGELRHVDFQAVSLTERVRAEVTVQLTGEAPAVGTYGGILVTNIEHLEVEALPRDLPDRLAVSVANLRQIGDAIYVRDLTLPENVSVHADPEDVVVIVIAPVIEAALVEEAVAEGVEPEVIEKGKREEVEE